LYELTFVLVLEHHKIQLLVELWQKISGFMPLLSVPTTICNGWQANTNTVYCSKLSGRLLQLAFKSINHRAITRDKNSLQHTSTDNNKLCWQERHGTSPILMRSITSLTETKNLISIVIDSTIKWTQKSTPVSVCVLILRGRPSG